MAGCGKVLYGNDEFGTMNCGDIFGRWVSDVPKNEREQMIWKKDDYPTLCKECSQSTKDKNNQQCLNGEKPIEGDVDKGSINNPTRTTETPNKDSVDNTSTTPADIILLAPNGKFTEKDMKLSDKFKRELEDIRKKLNSPEVAETMRL